jgi:hypothetical protein
LIDPSRGVFALNGGGQLAIERVEPNEAAIAAELLEVLAVFLRVAAENIESSKVDARLARGALGPGV